MPEQHFILPDDSQHLSIVGVNGSGKTQAAVWHLSNRNFHVHPWIIYDWKGDEHVNGIPGKIDIELNQLPESPGIYVTHPLPHEGAAVEAHMWEVYKRGEIGVYVDEGYMVGRNNSAFHALLMQGRSKRIPVIFLSQRPSWIDPFILSEAQFYQIFRLNRLKDRKAMQEQVPIDMERRLPEFHSWYYNSKAHKVQVMGPVPSMASIHAVFARRFAKRKEAV